MSQINVENLVKPAPLDNPVKNVIANIWRYRGTVFVWCDLLVICVCMFLAYFIRFHLDIFLHYVPMRSPTVPPVFPYAKAAVLMTVCWVFFTWREGGYRSDLRFGGSLGRQLRAVLYAGIYSVIFMMALGFLFRGLLVSRVVYVVAFLTSTTLLIVVRVGLHVLETYLTDQCIVGERIVLVGSQTLAGKFTANIQPRSCAMIVLGRLGVSDYSSEDASDDHLPFVGNLEQIEEIYDRMPFDSLLFLADRESDDTKRVNRDLFMHVINFCESREISFYMVPDSREVAVRKREVGSLGGVPVIELRDASLQYSYKVVKRLIDFSASLFILILGSPLWVAIALAIKLTSKGPVIYVQERVGLNGKPFPMYKFRTMVEDADEKLKDIVDFGNLKEPVFNIRDDPRVTSVGAILRRTSLDEIPQVMNVLLGQMSLVGPRPERVELVEKYDVWQRRRLKAKPGITGYQQVQSRGDPSLAKRLDYDLYYLKFQGLFLDLYILLRTVLVVVRGDGMR